MNGITKILLASGLIPLSARRIDKWVQNNSIEKLEFALKHGYFKIRKRVVKGLGEIRTRDCIPLLVTAVDDNIQVISTTAINILEKYSLSKDIETIIQEKKRYWSELELRQKESFKLKRSKLNTTESKWERPSKELFDNLKERLKRSLR